MHSFLTETTVRKVAGWCALASLIAAILMAFEYGRAMSYLHAVSLGLLAIAVPVCFVGSDLLRAQGRKTTAAALLVAGALMSVGEYMTHFGYTVGSRIADTQQTGVQNATYEAIQQNRESESKNLEIWRKQKVELQAERATMLKATPWATTLTADALRDELKDIDSRIAAEIKGDRGGRKAGCKVECERLKDQRKPIAERLAGVEKLDVVDNRIKELDRQLEATQRILDKKVDTAAKTEFHSSKIVNQTQAFAQLAAWDDKPSETTKSWMQLVLGAIIAGITTYLTLAFTTVAFSGIGKSPDDEIGYTAPKSTSLTRIDDRSALRLIRDTIHKSGLQAA